MPRFKSTECISVASYVFIETLTIVMIIIINIIIFIITVIGWTVDDIQEYRRSTVKPEKPW